MLNIKDNIFKKFFSPEYDVQKLLFNFCNCQSKLKKYLIRKKLIKRYGVTIGINAKIGKNLFLPHYVGIVIGEGAVIGDNCTIYQQVTLGQKNQMYPSVGNNVTIYAGAKIIGDIKIGDNSVIGANSVVINDVKKNSVVAGIPAKYVGKLNY